VVWQGEAREDGVGPSAAGAELGPFPAEIRLVLIWMSTRSL